MLSSYTQTDPSRCSPTSSSKHLTGREDRLSDLLGLQAAAKLSKTACNMSGVLEHLEVETGLLTAAATCLVQQK